MSGPIVGRDRPKSLAVRAPTLGLLDSHLAVALRAGLAGPSPTTRSPGRVDTADCGRCLPHNPPEFTEALWLRPQAAVGVTRVEAFGARFWAGPLLATRRSDTGVRP